jgi:nicotinamide phosphoribosyltransferase
MNINPLFSIDFYKTGHIEQYPEGTTLIYSNFTPRSNTYSNLPDHDNSIVFFGLQFFIKDFLINCWNENFFKRNKADVVTEYKNLMNTALDKEMRTEHIEALHDLGYLPLCIYAMPEGSRVKIGLPCLILYNTHPDFYWLTNYIETALSCYLWKPCVSATTARWYINLFEKYAEITGVDKAVCQFMGHDFSCRGMSNLQDAALSGAGHLLSFKGTDTVLSIKLLQDYYNATGYIGGSIPATEHSVMCMYGQENELQTFEHLLDVYDNHIFSIVSDTWDFWQVITDFLPRLKDKIKKRIHKLVIRPDSGDPVKIICGDPEAPFYSPQYRGVLELLWDTFGGFINDKGFKELVHVGVIYGDSITPERASTILKLMVKKGFVCSNVCFGIGSYTYQYVTRDTYGFAVKSTYGVVNGEPRDIFKNPKTDTGFKKSAKGLIKVIDGECVPADSVDDCGDMNQVFLDGKIMKDFSFNDLRRS